MPKPLPHTSMQAAARRALAPAAALLLAFALHAPAAAQKESCSVSGRVRESERGVPGVAVGVFSADPAQRLRVVARAKTDAEGRYALANLAPGRYQVLPYAPAYVVHGQGDGFPQGRPLRLQPGEEVKDLDFRVERGAVITGRVTDGDGNPVVAEPVTVEPILAPGSEPPPRFNFDMRDQMTADRGVYRVYGLPAGRYRVSVGSGGDEGAIAVSFQRRKIFRRTYHPDVTEAAQARVVELGAGDEAEGVDVKLGRPLKTYRASGVFVDAETGRPVPNVTFGYGSVNPAGQRVNSFSTGQATNARGEFQTEGLAPGRYVVFNEPGAEATEFYAEPTPFEVADSDVGGLVVKLKRGASVSGVVQIEGLSDRAAAARMLQQVRIYGFVETRNDSVPMNALRAPAPAPDGSFRVGGLRAGRLRMSFNMGDQTKGLSLSRIELNGANVASGIELKEGEQLTGVRIVLAYGSGVVTGQAGFEGGALPPGARVIARARPAG
ncbi:MAG TPA: carboxypeptidase-like regulatory domain-containing protein, partial [Pyrinomonadaceae bacterium]